MGEVVVLAWDAVMDLLQSVAIGVVGIALAAEGALGLFEAVEGVVGILLAKAGVGGEVFDEVADGVVLEVEVKDAFVRQLGQATVEVVVTLVVQAVAVGPGLDRAEGGVFDGLCKQDGLVALF